MERRLPACRRGGCQPPLARAKLPSRLPASCRRSSCAALQSCDNAFVVLADLLESLFIEALRRCSPRQLLESSQFVRELGKTDDVLIVGKCAAASYDALRHRRFARALVIVPEGYGEIAGDERATVLVTSHPYVSERSFSAGAIAQRFVRQSDSPLLVILSGGSSAALESPLQPTFRPDDLLALQSPLIRSGFSIEEINTVRKHLSAIKGGRLAAMTRRVVRTAIISDVDPATPHVVGSGPTLPDPTTNRDAADVIARIASPDALRIADVLRDCRVPDTPKALPNAQHEVIADNNTLQRGVSEIAIEHGLSVRRIEQQVIGGVDAVALFLVREAQSLRRGEIVVAGGEAEVVARGEGRGGRCSELAVRFALAAADHGVRDVAALFGASDGVDGTSGAAGVIVDPERAASAIVSLHPQIADALNRSDTISVADTIGRAIRIGSTGNNLRDLYILARH